MRLLGAVLLLLTACGPDETISGYAGEGSVWRLVELDGDRWELETTLALPSEGEVTGQAPCNTYFAEQTAPYPWFTLGSIGATRMACPDLDAETRYFASLELVTFAEVSGPKLILSSETGLEMVFSRSN